MTTTTPLGYTVAALSEDTVGAHEEEVTIIGEWWPADPDSGNPRPHFVHTDVINEQGISVMHLLDDGEWLAEACRSITEENK